MMGAESKSEVNEFYKLFQSVFLSDEHETDEHERL